VLWDTPNKGTLKEQFPSGDSIEQCIPKINARNIEIIMMKMKRIYRIHPAKEFTTFLRDLAFPVYLVWDAA